MKKTRSAQILYVHPNLSIQSIANTLSGLLEVKVLSIAALFRQQITKEDDLAARIKHYLYRGEEVDFNLIMELINVGIREIEFTDFLLLRCTKTLEQFNILSNTLKKENYTIDKIWCFKPKDSLLYFQKYYEEPQNKPYLEKYGDEIKEVWFKKNDEYVKEINEFHTLSRDRVNWNIIEIPYSGSTSLTEIIMQYLL